LTSPTKIIFAILLILIALGIILPSGLRAAIANNLWSIRFIYGTTAQPAPDTHPHADLFLARQAYAQGDLDQAIDHIEPLAESTDPIIQHTYASLLYFQEDYEGAFEIWGAIGSELTLEQALREAQANGQGEVTYLASQNLYHINPDKFAANYVSALTTNGEYQQALAVLDQSLETFPDSRYLSIWWRYKADIYKAQGDYAEAEKAYRRALLLNPQEMKALRDLGLMYRGQLKDLNKAIAVFKEYIAASPQEVYGYILLAQTYEEAGQVEKARQTYQELLEIDPTNTTAQQALSRLSEDN
jgi:tetratricopeptide (TPR) repeat protein